MRMAKETAFGSRLAMAVAVLCMAGCGSRGPQYRTTFEFAPPATPEGKTCVVQCENSKLQCQMLEDSQQLSCKQSASMEKMICEQSAERKYQDCVAAGNKFCVRETCIEDFCLKDSSHCDESYRLCYQNCGGLVTERKECVKRCEGIETQPQQPIQPTTTPSAPAATPAENTLAACKDSTDNDGDTYVDCADQDCLVFAICVNVEAVESGAD